MRLAQATVLLCLLTVSTAQAQTLWSRPYQPNQVAVEAILPDADDAALLSGATFLTASASLTNHTELLVELPVARFQPKSRGASSTALGNPFVGLGLSSARTPLLIQVGGRLPVASDNPAARLGAATDVGRLRAFVPEEFAITGLINGRFKMGRASTLRLRTGFAYASRPSVSGGGSRTRDWTMHYDAQLWREGNRLISGLSITGRAILDRPGTTQHHASLSLMANWPRVQPGLLVGTSLNDLLQDGRFAPYAGLTLSVSYGRF